MRQTPKLAFSTSTLALRVSAASFCTLLGQAESAAAVPGALLQLDEGFCWSGEMMSDEFSCWSPPPSSSVALVLHEFVRSDYARVVFK